MTYKQLIKNARSGKNPIFSLAPMADVTDAAFRRIIAKYGKPDLIYTEFVSCDGLCSEGQKALLPMLKFSKREKPIIAQLFGAKPENFYESAKLVRKLGFDGIDINMGCPQKNIVKQGAGSKLIESPKLSQEIIKETKRGAGGLPVSVKTRIGYNKNIMTRWIKKILEMEPAIITIHGRTRKEMSKVPADWSVIAKAVKLRDKMESKTLIIGNGDVKSLDDAKEKVEKYGVDGVMIGRAVFGNPWFFNPKKQNIPLAKKLSVMVEHTLIFEKMFGKNRSFNTMKKHFGSYVSGFKDAKKLRVKLMGTKNAGEVARVVEDLKRML